MKINSSFRTVCMVALIGIGLLASPAKSNAETKDEYVPTVLVTGANKEVGFSFTKKYVERGWNVIATDPTPEKNKALLELAAKNKNLKIETLNVADFTAIDALALKYKEQPIDILLSATRLMVGEARGGLEAQKFGQLDYSVFYDMARINALAPLKLIESFEKNVAASKLKKFMTVSSSNGVIGSLVKTTCRRCGNFFGKASFATTSMVIHRVDMHLRGRESQIIVGLLDPGPVESEALEPLVADNFPASSVISVDASVDGMMTVIDSYTLSNSAKFLNYRGKELPW